MEPRQRAPPLEGGGGGSLWWRRSALSFLIGATVGTLGTYAALTLYNGGRKRREESSSESPSVSSPLLRLGAPTPAETLSMKEGYITCVDHRTRNPKWVLERIQRRKEGETANNSRDNIPFYEDQAIPRHMRSKLEDYAGSGYDRGHMAPASNHKATANELKETFSLSNIAPQVGRGFNRDYWARFERFVTLLGRSRTNTEAYVITGPLYLPEPIKNFSSVSGGGNNNGKPPPNPPRWQMRYPCLGHAPWLTSVPTHFFKVVAVVPALQAADGGDAALVGAFVIPNAAIPPDTPLSAFAVPLNALESAAGMQFFAPWLDGKNRRTSLEMAEKRWFAKRRELPRSKDRGAPVQLLLPEVPSSKRTPKTDATPSALMTVGHDTPLRVAHVCEVTGCTLPREKFWEDFKKNDTNSKGSSRKSLRS